MAEAISWGSLPNIPRIMIDFIARRGDIITLLGGDWRDDAARKSVGERRSHMQRSGGLGAAVRQGYGDSELPPAVERNIEALDQPDTLAVVTGQQVGIFGGPLYTFYKALTAVMLARALQSEAPGAVVPIFWMETSDVDFSEVNRIGFPPRDESSRQVVYTPHKFVSGRSVRFHRLDQGIETVRSAILECLEDLPHRDAVIELIERTYIAGQPIATAFRELMTGLFAEQGLVMVDPLDPVMMTRSRGFWELCLERPDKLNKSFAIASREIESRRLPLQVRLRDDALPILHLDNDGIRRRIFGEPGAWSIGRNGDQFDDDQLREMACAEPGSLTPSALLRPLLQDWLLPTWIYVADAAEVAFQAQIGRCYDLLNIQRPMIAPRIGLTLVERPAQRLLERHGWKVAEVIGGREILLLRAGKTEALEELFDNGSEQLKGWLERIERAAEEAAVNLSLEVDRASRKLTYQWDKIKRVTVKKIAERDRVRVSHAQSLLDLIMPGGMLQERHDNGLYYLAAYGPGLTQAIEAEVDLFNPCHLAIDLEPTRD